MKTLEIASGVEGISTEIQVSDDVWGQYQVGDLYDGQVVIDKYATEEGEVEN